MSVSAEDIARVVHAANSEWQAITGDELPSPPWDSAPDWQRDAALDGVRAALAGATPEELHETWCEGKRAAGWVYGSVKDPDSKTHPCLVPYGNLPEFQRVKDRLFCAIVGALAGEPDAAPVARPRPGWGRACDHPLDGHVDHGPWCA